MGGLMKPWRARRLTPGERALAAEVFGEELDAERVRLIAFPPLGWTTKRAFAPGNLLWPGRSLIVYPPEQALLDFAAPGTPLSAQGVFVHELTHVWQSQAGVNLLFAKLRCGDSPAAYRYALHPGAEWPRFNIEQQAMIVQHAFLARRGGATPYPAEACEAVLPFRKRTVSTRV